MKLESPLPERAAFMSNNPVTVTDIFALEVEPPIDFTVPAFGLDLELPAEGVKR